MSLRYKILFLFSLAIILPALLSSLILTSISRRTIHNLIFHQQHELLSRVADRINQQLDRHQQILLENKNIPNLQPRQQLASAADIISRGKPFSELSLMDTRGREVWKFRRGGRARDLVRKSGKPEYIEARYGKLYISKVYSSEQSAPYVMISVPCSRPQYVLSAKLELSSVWKMIKDIRIGETTGHAFIVDKTGELIAHREQERVYAHSNFSGLPAVKDFLAGKVITPDTWSVYKGEDGEKVVSLYQPLGKLGWAVVAQIPYSEVYSPIKKMYGTVFIWTVIWVGVFWVIGFAFVRRIVGPIEQLKTGASKISQGKLDVKFEISTGDEIQELAADFEKMALALKQLDELREDLIKMIIHDLKGPLSGIMGGLEYLESGFSGNLGDDQRKILHIARKSSENLLVMIQNLLDVAKMEEGKLELHKEKLNLKEIVLERKAQFDALAAREEKTITLDPSAEDISVEADKNLIERVLNNLISNALHHTTSGGKIALNIKKQDGFVSLSISDNGMGIPQEYKDKIFEKFVQVKRKQAHLRTGAGLGLTFCKMAVENHGGFIRVESELNEGSSFIFTLPANG